MDGLIQIVFYTLSGIAKRIAKWYFGPTPSKDALDSATLAKLYKLESATFSPVVMTRGAIILIVGIPIALGILVLLVVTKTLWVLALVFVCLLALVLIVCPFAVFFQYGRDRRMLIRRLRSIGPLKQCPTCLYDVSHTEVQQCPECGEPVGMLKP